MGEARRVVMDMDKRKGMKTDYEFYIAVTETSHIDRIALNHGTGLKYLGVILPMKDIAFAAHITGWA